MGHTIKILAILLVITSIGCKEKYIPPITASETNYLVVEGYINVGQDSTVIRLTRTRNLSDTGKVVPETGATLQVQSTGGAVYPLQEQGEGYYYTPFIAGDNTQKYSLNITTADNKQYASDYLVSKAVPVIDSLNWAEKPDGVYIYASAHDDQGQTKYYKWDYVETWEYHAPFDSYYEVAGGGSYAIIGRPSDQRIFACWHTANSSNISIASSTKLAKDFVYEQQINFIPAATERLGVTYSILVKQYALTQQGYNYWQTLIKNTEQLGSLFDAQPSLLTGNIHSITNKNEPVLGFLTASTVQQKRFFIKKSALTKWDYPPSPYSICDTVHIASADQEKRYYGDFGYIPINNYNTFNYYAAPAECADCRLQGGTLTKPSFWP